MKIFVSWSGERSQLLAQALHEWLPLVLHYVAPWLSQANIEAGERWANEVAKELEDSNFGIICATQENIVSPWILFEAGALAKSMQGSRVTPLLFDLEFRDIAGPLAQFQAKKADKPGVWEIVNSINQNTQQPVPEARVKQLFDALWPEFEKRLNAIPKQAAPTKHARPQAEILEELVSSVRALDSRFREISEDSPRGFRRKRGRLHPMFMDEMLHVMRRKSGDPLALLMIASLVRDEAPWLYEMALQAYRDAQSGSRAARTSLARFKEAARLMIRHPLSDELGVDPRTLHMCLDMLEQFAEPRIPRARPRPRASTQDSEEAGVTSPGLS